MITATESASTAGVSMIGAAASTGRCVAVPTVRIGLDTEPATYRDVVTDRVEHGDVVAVGDHRVAAGVAHDELELRTGQPEVQRNEDGPEACGGEHRLEERRMVEPQVSDPVAVADPAVTEHGGDRSMRSWSCPYVSVEPSNVRARRFGDRRARCRNQLPKLMSGDPMWRL